MKPVILDNMSHATTKHMHLIYDHFSLRKDILIAKGVIYLKSCNLLNNISIPEYKIFSKKSI